MIITWMVCNGMLDIGLLPVEWVLTCGSCWERVSESAFDTHVDMLGGAGLTLYGQKSCNNKPIKYH